MPEVRVCGIDWATTPAKRAAVTLQAAHGSSGIRVCEILSPLPDARVVTLCKSGDLGVVAIDTPFGWPQEFARFVASWSPGGGTSGVPGSERFRYRTTDRLISQELQKWPLSVSSDRIGLAARSWVEIVERHALTGQIDVGVGQASAAKPALIEVYPGATLAALYPKRHEVRTDGYKAEPEIRRSVLAALFQDFQIECEPEQLERLVGTGSDSDRMDALVAAWTGLLYLGQVEGRMVRLPAGEETEAARAEGWIFFPVRSG